MSSDLSNNEFPTQAENGALSWLLEAFRTRMRDTAKFVRMEAAWRTWPTVHRVAKALHENLITAADTEAERQNSLHAMAERCALFYPTEEHLIRALQDAGRNEVALTIGGGLDEGNSNFHGITLDDVLELYRREHAQTREAYVAANPSLELP